MADKKIEDGPRVDPNPKWLCRSCKEWVREPMQKNCKACRDMVLEDWKEEWV